MATLENTVNQLRSISERVTRVETIVEEVLPHFATKADMERQTRLLVMWMIATQMAMAALILTVLGNQPSTG